MFDNQTREWILIASTTETSMTIIGVTATEVVDFGVTAVNAGGESEFSTASSAGGAPEVTLAPIANLSAEGATDDYDLDGVEDHAIEWTWTDDVNEEGCLDGSDELVDCLGNEFCNDQCGGATGYDSCLPTDVDVNGDGAVNTWIGDGFCDDGSYGLFFQCDELSWDCGDCGDPIVDPNGYCDDAPPVSCEDEGLITCPDGSCADSFDDCPEGLVDCDGVAFTEEYLAWIGDGYCDGTDAAWGLNFACAEYDCDGCDCVGDPGQSAECEAECGGEAVNPGGEKQLFSSNPERIRPSFKKNKRKRSPNRFNSNYGKHS